MKCTSSATNFQKYNSPIYRKIIFQYFWKFFLFDYCSQLIEWKEKKNCFATVAIGYNISLMLHIIDRYRNGFVNCLQLRNICRSYVRQNRQPVDALARHFAFSRIKNRRNPPQLNWGAGAGGEGVKWDKGDRWNSKKKNVRAWKEKLWGRMIQLVSTVEGERKKKWITITRSVTKRGEAFPRYYKVWNVRWKYTCGAMRGDHYCTSFFFIRSYFYFANRRLFSNVCIKEVLFQFQLYQYLLHRLFYGPTPTITNVYNV